MAEMIRQITEAGASPEVIAVAVSCFEQMSGTSPGQVRDIARKYERERKRQYRKNHQKTKANAEANDAARAAENVRDTDSATAYLLTPLSSNSEKKTSEKEGKKRGGDTRARGTRLSEGLPLPDEYRRFAESEGVENVDAMWVEFVDYWIAVPGQRGCKANWFSTWRNNVRRNLARGKPNVRSADNTLTNAIDGLRQYGRSGH